MTLNCEVNNMQNAHGLQKRRYSPGELDSNVATKF